MDAECDYLKEYAGTLYPYVEEVLDYLHNKYDLFIVSNCQDGYIEALFSVYNIQKYIKDYECSGRTGKSKGENIRMIMDRNKVTDAVYIGDTQKDKEASSEAKIPFLYAAYGFGKVEDCQHKIDSFKDLLTLF